MVVIHIRNSSGYTFSVILHQNGNTNSTLIWRNYSYDSKRKNVKYTT